MAIIQHSALTHAKTHEPRWIGINGTGASGKVITNDASTSGISEYRNLKFSDIIEKDFLFDITEYTSTTAQTHYWPAHFDGTIISWRAVVNGILATATNTYELRINGVQVTSTPFTFALAGAAGDQKTATATAANTFTTGTNIQIVGTTIGNTNAAINTRFVVLYRKA